MSRVLKLTSALLLVSAACGDNQDIPSTVDATDRAMPTAYFVGGDFVSTGILSKIDVATGVVTPNALAGVAGGEPWIRRLGNEVFIVNRAGGDNVTVLGGSPLRLIDQFSTGRGTNPHDVAVVGDKLYVTAYETEGLVVIDRTTRAITRIDLQAGAMDTDGKPDCSSVYAVQNRVFVACQRQNRADPMNWVTRGPGRVVVVDTSTDTVIATSSRDLEFANPSGRFVAPPAGSTFAGDLLITTTPTFADYSTGCLERVSTRTPPEPGACAIENSVLGGLVAAADAAPDGDKLWLAVHRYQSAPFAEFGHLRSLDLSTGVLDATFTPTTGGVRDVAACPAGYVVATDGTTGAAGLRIWREGVETTATPLVLGREPQSSNGLVCL